MALRKRKTVIEPFALEHTNIVTGDEDGRTLDDMTIVIDENGRISQVMPSKQIGVPQGYHRIDASGKFVAPGLINLHVHLFSDGRPIDPKQATPKGQALLSKLVRTLQDARISARRPCRALTRCSIPASPRFGPSAM